MSMLTVSMLPASLSEVRGAGWGAEKLASTRSRQGEAEDRIGSCWNEQRRSRATGYAVGRRDLFSKGSSKMLPL